MRPLRILHVINGSAIGGAERLLLSLLGRHDPAAVDVTVCNTFFATGPFVDALRDGGHRVVTLPARSARTAGLMTLRLARHLRNERYDIVHTHLIHSTIAGQYAARLARAGVLVVTRHYTDEGYAGKSALVRNLDARAARAATHVVAVSEFVRAHLISTGVPPERITVIYNGVDLQEIDAAVGTRDHPRARQGLHLGAVGSLTARKGHDVLLRALANVPAHLIARLTIVGDGPERERLQSLIAQLGIGARVELAGYRSDVVNLLRDSDIYVQPSLQESFGIAVLEALAARLPVVASRTGGIPEIIQDGQSGVLVEPGDADALAAALIRVAENDDLRTRLAANGRQRVQSTFSIDVIARRYESFYRSLAPAAVATAVNPGSQAR